MQDNAMRWLTPTHNGCLTTSQRAKLRALQQRRESGTAGAGDKEGGPSLPRVRNYNVQSDNEWKSALCAMAVAGIAPSAVSS